MVNGNKVLVIQEIHPAGMKKLSEVAEVIVPNNIDNQTIIEEGKDVDGLIVRLTKVDEELICSLNNLKVIGRYGVGVDNIDIVTATKRGISVVNTFGVNSLSVSEYTLLAMLFLSRNIMKADKAVRDGNYNKRSQLIGREINGKTLGLIGFGSIGQLVAKNANELGVDILYYDPYLNSTLENRNFRKVDLTELLEQADFVSLHIPLTNETKHFIDADKIKMMKKDSFLINASRGEVVNEKDLYIALKNNEIAGAAIDIMEIEPFPSQSPLYELENIVITPHIAGVTEESSERMAISVVDGVIDVLNGKPPINLVNYV